MSGQYRFLTFHLRLAAFFLSITAISVDAEAVAMFQGLGDLPGRGFFSQANGTSTDGSVVVGYSASAASDNEAFVWTSGTGMVGLGDLPGGVFTSQALAVSRDGSTVVGLGTSATGQEAFRWVSGTGLVGLGDLPGGIFRSEATDVSANGSVVVGNGRSAAGPEAFRWTSATGMVGLGELPGGAFGSQAFGTSSDGSVVVGSSFSASGNEAFRWTSGTGMVGLGDLPGGSFDSRANGTSSDGSVVVGNSFSASGREAFRWTIATGMVGLGDLPGGSFESEAFDTSGDGAVVVGNGSSAAGPEAFLWTAEGGMRKLADVVAEFGGTTTGFTLLNYALDLEIFDNTATVVGRGLNASGNEGFRAQIPVVSASVADELLSLTPGLTSDTLALDVSATRLLYGDVGRYEFDFTTDGIYDLVLDVGTPLFNSYWDAMTESFLFPELDVRNFYPDINTGGFGSLSFTTTIRLTHENGTAINTSEAIITVVPEVRTISLLSLACVITAGLVFIRRQGQDFPAGQVLLLGGVG